jgi:hypothetical protein
MKPSNESRLPTPNRQRRKVWRILWPVSALCAVLVVAAMFLPVLDGPHRRQHANESVSVSKLLAINTLQRQYASAHPKERFTCELPLLKSGEPAKDSYYDPEEFLVSGTQSGYRFVVVNCHADSNGVVAHYEVTAAPVEPDKSGFRAFCTDDSGLLWYDKDGSPANCLTSRRLLH